MPAKRKTVKKWANYEEYLQSAEWKALREEAKERAGRMCENCGANANLVVHHWRYPDLLTHDDLENLVTLCRPCHDDLHIDKIAGTREQYVKLIKDLTMRERQRNKAVYDRLADLSQVTIKLCIGESLPQKLSIQRLDGVDAALAMQSIVILARHFDFSLDESEAQKAR